ncbi:hypothetical protein [Arcanobacterium haemolyticum]
MDFLSNPEWCTALTALIGAVFSVLNWRANNQKHISFTLRHWYGPEFMLQNTGNVTVTSVVPLLPEQAITVPSGSVMSWPNNEAWATINPGEDRRIVLPVIREFDDDPLFPPQILIGCKQSKKPIPVQVHYPEHLLYDSNWEDKLRNR